MSYKNLLGIVVFLLAASIAYSFLSGVLQLKTVLSGSMSPEFNAGDVIVISQVSWDDIKVGDVITFRTGKTLTTHRVVEVLNGSFRTKGDANEDPDAGQVDVNSVVGRHVFTIPYMGYLGVFVRTPLGFSILILLPGLFIIISEIKKILEELNIGDKSGRYVPNSKKGAGKYKYVPKNR